MAMLSLGRAILLMSMWVGDMVCDAYSLEEGSQFLIPPPPNQFGWRGSFCKVVVQPVAKNNGTYETHQICFLASRST
jgi:hypothetical protein